MKSLLLFCSLFMLATACSTPKEEYKEDMKEAQEEFKEEKQEIEEDYNEAQKEEAVDYVQESEEAKAYKDKQKVEVKEE